MFARYFDPAGEAVVDSDVGDAAELEAVLAAVAGMCSGRGRPAVELSRGDGSSLVVALTPTGAVLLWTDPLGSSFHSVGDPAAEGLAVFDYFGSYTEVPEMFIVGIEDARKAAVGYLNAGFPMSGDLTMEPD